VDFAPRVASALSGQIRELDIISRMDIEVRLGIEKVDAVVGSMIVLAQTMSLMIETVQRDGKPRDLAEEQWIYAVADIYEAVFSRKAAAWGSSNRPKRLRGPFYQLLEVSRPPSFHRYGKLHPKQVDAVLKRRLQSRST
jgi:hypothetical protein